jgi:5-oxoprolinase (ATP-hydrolysing) subunit A
MRGAYVGIVDAISRIDLNADLGEGVTDDPGLLAVVTSANVACGYHAGDAATMTAVCRVAARRGVVVGAQVSYDDRENFGRRALDVEPSVLRDQVLDQVSVLDRIAGEAGTRVAYVKPHGALYNRVVDDAEQARAVLDGSGDLPVLGLPGSVILDLAGRSGRRVWREGFPDRGYTEPPFGGRLLPRDQEGALVGDAEEVARRAVDMARSGHVDSVCVHGDSPGAVATARAVREALEADGIDVRPV